MKPQTKGDLHIALLGIGLSAQEARAAVRAFSEAMSQTERVLVVDDFAGLTSGVITELKSEEYRRKNAEWFGQSNHPDGWYRMFEKPHGKRNLRSR